MFVAAFPLAPLIALVTNLVEIRIDAINFIKAYRRPVAYNSAGIGVWYDILVTLTTLAVLVNGFVLSLTSEFIPRLVYKYRESVDGTLSGYVDWSLSHFPIKDFDEDSRPEVMLPIDFAHKIENITYCRYPGFHLNNKPYSFNMSHWYLMTIRLVFAFLFQWTVSATGRILAWIIPDLPRSLDLKIKRQEYLAKDALRKYKIRTGKRKPDEEEVSDEEEDVLESDDSLEKGVDSSSVNVPLIKITKSVDETLSNAPETSGNGHSSGINDGEKQTSGRTSIGENGLNRDQNNYSHEYLTQML